MVGPVSALRGTMIEWFVWYVVFMIKNQTNKVPFLFGTNGFFWFYSPMNSYRTLCDGARSLFSQLLYIPVTASHEKTFLSFWVSILATTKPKALFSMGGERYKPSRPCAAFSYVPACARPAHSRPAVISFRFSKTWAFAGQPLLAAGGLCRVKPVKTKRRPNLLRIGCSLLRPPSFAQASQQLALFNFCCSHCSWRPVQNIGSFLLGYFGRPLRLAIALDTAPPACKLKQHPQAGWMALQVKLVGLVGRAVQVRAAARRCPASPLGWRIQRIQQLIRPKLHPCLCSAGFLFSAQISSLQNNFWARHLRRPFSGQAFLWWITPTKPAWDWN